MSENEVDYRVIKKFLLRPRRVNNKWHWLKTVEIFQVFDASMSAWVDIAWDWRN